MFLFKKKFCKFEQCSNWKARPLSKTQLHYGALDAGILIQIYNIVSQKLVKEVYNQLVQKKDDEFISVSLADFSEIKNMPFEGSKKKNAKNGNKR